MSSIEDIRKTKIRAALENTNLTFGSLIRTIRSALGVKLYTACEETGIGDQKMRAFELGRFTRRPDETDIKLLAEYYGIEYENLVDRVDKHIERSHKKRVEKGLI